MPTLCLSSPLLKTTADGLSLSKFPPPESLDILSTSSIVLRLTGSFERKEIPTDALRRSSLVAYLLEYLKFHAAQLFISNISDPYVSADGTLEFAIASSRALLDPDELPVPTATLVAINWTFAWKSNSTENASINPFSSQHLLPVQSVVSPLIEKVLSRDFVRRYPLIFGSWRNSLGTEMDVFPHIAQPILNIIARSQNSVFRRQCKKLLRSLRTSNNTAHDNSLDRLQDVLGSLVLNDMSAPPHKDDERVLLVSLQRLFRTLFRAERFKDSTFSTKSDDSLYSPDHRTPSSDTLLEHGDSVLFEDLDDPPLADEPPFMDLFTESESSQETETTNASPAIPHIWSSNGSQTPILRMLHFETFGLREAADTGHLFGADTDLFTLAGLDDDWKMIDLQPNFDDDLGCMALDLDGSPTGFPWHTSTPSDDPRIHDLGAAPLDQTVLELDSDVEETGEEAVLDF